MNRKYLLIFFVSLVFSILFAGAVHAEIGACIERATQICGDQIDRAQCGTGTTGTFTFFAGKTCAQLVPTNCCCIESATEPWQARVMYESNVCGNSLYPVFAAGNVYPTDGPLTAASCATACALAEEANNGNNGTTGGGGGGGGSGDEPDNGPDPTPNDCTTCTASISGTVTASFPLPNLVIVKAVKSGFSTYAVVQADGTYSIRNLAAGTYSVSIDSTDFYAAAQSIVLNLGEQRTNVDLVLLPKNLLTITGKVKTAAGVGISQAIVQVSQLPIAVMAATDGTYTVKIPNAKLTSYTLVASGATIFTKSFVIAVPTGQSTITQDLIVDLNTCAGSIPAPVLTLNHVKGVSSVRLNWSMPTCANLIDGYTVLRCDGTTATCTDAQFFPITSVGSGVLTVTDSSTAWSRTYTYKVLASSGGRTSESAKVQITTGEVACAAVTDTNYFCSINTTMSPARDIAVRCTTNNTLQVKEVCPSASKPTSTLCVESVNANGDPDASCIAPSACGEHTSANPFSLYYDEALCNAKSTTCYYDRGTTSVNTCLSCQPIMTCGSYGTKSACEADRCYASNDGCQWIQTNTILNTGVCVDKKKPSCTDCNAGNLCDEDSCRAISSLSASKYACTFSGGDCKSCAQTSCYGLTTQTECGASGGTLNSATNELAPPSSNSCNLLSCNWVANACVKDADANGIDDCSIQQGTQTLSQTECRSDKVPPVTYVFFPTNSNPAKTDATMRFLALDEGKTGASQVSSTRICITGGTNGPCSDVNAYSRLTDYTFTVSGTSLTLDGKTYSLEPGSYTLKYYSIDKAWNREIVKEFRFNITNTIGNIRLSYQVIPGVVPGEKADVLVKVETDRPARCVLTFYDLASQVTAGMEPIPISTPFALSAQQLFYDKVDGIYTVKASCVDDIGNEGVRLLNPVAVSSDGRIVAVFPRGIVNNSGVRIEAVTSDAVDCRWSETEYNFVDMTSPADVLTRTLAADGTYRHRSALMTFTEGPHDIFVACNHDPESNYLLQLVVDTQLPTVRFETPAGAAYNFTKWQLSATSAQSLLARCTDLPAQGYGCGYIEYCITPLTPTPSQCVLNRTVAYTINPVPIPLLETSAYVCARAKENNVTAGGGRVSPVTCNSVLIDTAAPYFIRSRVPSSVSQLSLDSDFIVIDPTYKLATKALPMARGLDSVREFIESPTAFSANNAAMGGVITATLPGVTNVATQLSELTYEVFLRYSDANNNYKLMVEPISGTSNHKVSIIRTASGTQTVLNSTTVKLTSTTIPFAFIITRDFTEARFASAVVSASSPAPLRGTLGVRVSANIGAPVDATITNVAASDVDIASLLTISTYINGLRVAQTTVQSGTPLPITTILPATLVNGQIIDFKVNATDAAGQSTSMSFPVIYDKEGPLLTAIKFYPTTTQTNSSFIEYGTDARGVVFASDNGLASATVSIATIFPGQNTTVTFTNATTTNISGLISTRSFPEGYSDAWVTVTDVSGNRASKSFTNAILVLSTKNPKRQINTTSPLYTKDTTPTLNITVSPQVTCNVSYLDANGVSRIDRFAPSGSTFQEVTLSNPLPAVADGELASMVTIFCSDLDDPRVDNWGTRVKVVVDNQGPVVGFYARFPGDVVTTLVNRTLKSYVALTEDEYSLHAVADENVLCSYIPVNSAGDPMGSAVKMLNASRGQSTMYDSVAVKPAAGDSVSRFLLSCIDQSGNDAVIKRYVTVSVEKTHEPVLFGVYPSEMTNTTAPMISFRTVRDLGCTAMVDSSAVNLNFVSGAYRGTVSPSLSQGTHSLIISCNDPSVGGATVKKSFTFPIVVDTVAPQVTITPSTNSNGVYTFTSVSTASLTGNVSEPVSAAISVNGVLIDKQLLSAGSFTLPIRVGQGMWDVEIAFTDAGNNTIVAAPKIYVVDENYGFIVPQWMDLYKGQAASVRGLNVLLSANPTAGLRATFTATPDKKLGSTGSVAPTTQESLFSSNRSLATPFTLPTTPGIYVGRISIVTNNGSVNQKSFTFSVDPLTEVVTIHAPTPKRSETLLVQQFNISTEYQNVITAQTIENVKRPSDVVVDFSEKKIMRGEYKLSEGWSKIVVSAFNELGHTAQRVIMQFFDAQPPQIDVRLLSGQNGESRTPYPQFQVTFTNEPAFLTSAVIKSATGSSFNVNNSASVDPISSVKLQSVAPLVDGSYKLILVARDVYGNTNSGTPYEFPFIVNRKPTEITIVSPEFGRKAANPMILVVGTDRPAQCRYAGANSTQAQSFATMFAMIASNNASMQNATHSATFTLGAENFVFTYLVSCVDEYGIQANKTIGLAIDSRKPVITRLATTSPENTIVAPPFETNLTVSTSIEARCKYSIGAAPYASMTEFSSFRALVATENTQKVSNMEDKKTYVYNVQCESAAGVLSEVSTVSVKVDTTAPQLIKFKTPAANAAYNSTSIPVKVVTSLPVIDGSCSWGFNDDFDKTFVVAANKTELTATQVFNVGENRIAAKCAFNDGKGGTLSGTTSISFYVDTTAPVANGVTVPANVSGPNGRSVMLSAKFNFTDEESPIVLYEYSIGTAAYPSTGWNDTLSQITVRRAQASNYGMNLTDGETYFWTVRATNKIGYVSNYISSSGTLVKIISTNRTNTSNETIYPPLPPPGYEDIDPACLDDSCEIVVEEPPQVIEEPVEEPDTDFPIEEPPEEEKASVIPSGLWFLLLALLLIGGGLGYVYYGQYERKKQARERILSAPTQMAPIVQTRPLTVQDKIKNALATKLREQRMERSKERIFGSFDTPATSGDTKKSSYKSTLSDLSKAFDAKPSATLSGVSTAAAASKGPGLVASAGNKAGKSDSPLKTTDAKTSPSEKSSAAKPSESKSSETKPAESKPSDAKPSLSPSKVSDMKVPGAKPADAKTPSAASDSKSAEVKKDTTAKK
ncbi:MAG TPA: carboxypeptidase regulatory-like domain-containing protein [Acidobacteriota bacterium]|nr:carboxypeptidase regulatory-like domain-containing protein [Acidobacteriota bacterium]